MPIYDYRCQDCGHEVEVIHGIEADGPAICEVCGGALRKALTTPAIHFKGSGWAKKDAQAARKAKTSGAAESGETANDNKLSDGSASSETKTQASDSGNGSATAEDSPSGSTDAGAKPTKSSTGSAAKSAD